MNKTKQRGQASELKNVIRKNLRMQFKQLKACSPSLKANCSLLRLKKALSSCCEECKKENSLGDSSFYSIAGCSHLQ